MTEPCALCGRTRTDPRPYSRADGAYWTALDAVKRRMILRAVIAAHGNRTLAARRLGLNAKYFFRLIRELDMTGLPPAVRGGARPGCHRTVSVT